MPLLLHSEIVAAVRDEFVELLEGAFVQEQLDALPRGKFAFLVLALAAFRAPPASASALRRRISSRRSCGLPGLVIGFWVRHRRRFGSVPQPTCHGKRDTALVDAIGKDYREGQRRLTNMD